MRYLTMLLLLTLSLACAQDNMPATKTHAGHPASTAISFRNSVQKMADDWRSAFQAKDADKIAAMYTDDAVWINPEGTFHGTSEIKQELKKMMDRGDTVAAIPATKAVRGSGLGWAEGTFSGTVPNPKGGDAVPNSGSWITTLKNANGKWLIATHTSVPAATPKSMADAPK